LWTVAGIATVLLSACGGGGGTDSPVAPGPVTPTPPAPTATLTIGDVDLEMSGQNTAATIRLASVAPAGGVQVGLSASHSQAVSLPSNVTISEGATGVTVPILTGAVPVPTTVIVTATVTGQPSPLQAALPLQPGSFVSFISATSDFVGRGRAKRLTDADFSFSATVRPALDQLELRGQSRTGGDSWRLAIFAVAGTELRAGSYAGGVGNIIVGPIPSITFAAFGRACSSSSTGGAFIIDDVQYGPGPTLRRLSLDFVQSCNGSTPLVGRAFVEAL
jgi:hypothetical protein